MGTSTLTDARTTSICYLCGETLTPPISRDHIPPRQFFGKVFRRAGELDEMDWLPTHHNCNESYSRDEEYFTATFATVAVKRPAGQALLEDIAERVKRGSQIPLSKMVDAELEPVEGMPEGMPKFVKKSFNRKRVERVIWKILRGIHFLRTQRFVPELTPQRVWWGHGDEGIPAAFAPVVEMQSEGRYPQAFDYRVLSARINSTQVGHVYLMLFFDSMLYAMFFEESFPEVVQPGALIT